MPFLPRITAGASQAIADVEVREELFTSNRAKAFHEPGIRKLTADLVDFLGVLGTIFVGAAQLFERLSALIKRYPGSVSTRRSATRRAGGGHRIHGVSFGAGQNSLFHFDALLLRLK